MGNIGSHALGQKVRICVAHQNVDICLPEQVLLYGRNI